MKWNDAWLSNIDRDFDGKLDRPSDNGGTYIGSGAWETNYMWDSYVGDDGKEHHWNYFTKIVAVPSDAELDDGLWYTAEGIEIGPTLWGSFAFIFEVSNDLYSGEHGVLYNAPAATGFGYYKP